MNQSDQIITNLIDEVVNLNNDRLMAIERSFFSMISIGKTSLKRRCHENASKDEIEVLIDSLSKRRVVYKAISQELVRRIGYEVCASLPKAMKFSLDPLPEGIG
jgi:hypothetical protein